MSVWFDGNFWSHYFEEIYIPRINAFCEVVIDRVLSTLVNIEKEADQVAQSEFDRLGSQPAGDDSSFDMADIAEKAFDTGLIYYETINAIRQAIINLGAVGLHHMFEQQLMLFYRRQVLHPSEEDKNVSINEIKQGFKDGGVDVEKLLSWVKVHELRVVANSIKHGEGDAADKLRKLRPDLFEHPALKGQGLSALASSPRVDSPLSGQDIYLTVKDLQKYQDALVGFWREFGSQIRKLSAR